MECEWAGSWGERREGRGGGRGDSPYTASVYIPGAPSVIKGTGKCRY